jgi:uncharacterized protein (TIGR02147 family)
MVKHMNLFDFKDYRLYLKSWLKLAKQAGRSNVNKLADVIGIHPTYLSQVISGGKNLSLEQAAILSVEVQFTEIEQEYFFALIQLDRSGTQQLKKYWEKQISRIRKDHTKLNSRVGKHHELTDTERAIYYSSWLYAAIFVATSINGGQTLDQIADRFELSREKASEILTFLTRAGICDFKDGVYRMGKQTVYVPNDSPFVVKHHSNWRLKAIQKMDTREDRELFFSSPMSISTSDVAKIRDILTRAVEQAQKVVQESGAEELVCLNMDFFRVQ